ncbi:MAG: type II toxin-antitoxin system RelE/ParE family toxin [Terriglobales bacterium]|jgi:toxin ParE1/3/4
MSHRRSALADSDLDEIWYYVASRSGSTDAADRLIGSITDRFPLLASYPNLGRARNEDLRPGLRTFPVGDYIIFYRIEGEDVVILRVLRGSRNIAALFGH